MASLLILWKFSYLDDTREPRGGAADNVITKTWRRWSKFRDLVSLLSSRGFPFGAKSRLYPACICGAMPYGKET